MGSSYALTSSDSGTSMPTESQEESISSMKLTSGEVTERRTMVQPRIRAALRAASLSRRSQLIPVLSGLRVVRETAWSARG